jgi:hypothetical protein
VDVLAIFLGLIVIWADDILCIECHLAVKAETNRAILIDKSFISWNSCGGVVLFLFLLVSAIFIVC